MSSKKLLKRAKKRKERNKAVSSMTALEKAYFGVHGKDWKEFMIKDKLR